MKLAVLRANEKSGGCREALCALPYLFAPIRSSDGKKLESIHCEPYDLRNAESTPAPRGALLVNLLTEKGYEEYERALKRACVSKSLQSSSKLPQIVHPRVVGSANYGPSGNYLFKCDLLPCDLDTGPKRIEWEEGSFGKTLHLKAKFRIPSSRKETTATLVAMPVTQVEANLLRDPSLRDFFDRMTGEERPATSSRQDEYALMILRGWHHGFAHKNDNHSYEDWQVYKLLQKLLATESRCHYKELVFPKSQVPLVLAGYRPQAFEETQDFLDDKKTLAQYDC